MEKATRLASLYDVYAMLLTERQREWTELHYFEDLSLAEIAEQFGVTRQAVHDNLRRAEEQLESYERVLHLLSVRQWRVGLLQELRALCEEEPLHPAAQMERILQLVDELLREG